MSENDEREFDALLSGCLKQSLDMHVGRCERRFRYYLADLRRVAWKQRTWLLGAFMSGMAATVALLWATPMLRPGPSAPNEIPTVVKTDTVTQPGPTIPGVERVVQSHTTDEGVMLFGNDIPVRVFHRQQLQQTRWLNDKQQVQSEQTTPQDDTVFIRVPTY